MALSSSSNILTLFSRPADAETKGDDWYAWNGASVLSLGIALDHESAVLERVRTVVRGVVDGALVIYGLAGVAAGVLVWMDLFPLSATVLQLCWWTALFTDCFAYTRIVREAERHMVIRGDRRTAAGALPLPPPASWEDAASIARRSRLPVMEYVVAPAHHAVRRAERLAERMGSAALHPLHLFAAILDETTIVALLVRLGVSQQGVGNATRHALSSMEKGQRVTVSEPFVRALFQAYEDAASAKRDRVSIVELFGALAKDSSVAEILFDAGTAIPQIQRVVRWMQIQEVLYRRWRQLRSRGRSKPIGPMNRTMTSAATPMLDRVSTDVTAAARSGRLGLCVGRDRELEEVVRIMEGGQHSVVLVGEAGIGKKSIVYGLAQRMVEEDVPEVLFDKRLVSLSVSAILSGAAHVGEIEERLSLVFRDVIRSRNVIVFIDDIHTLVGVSTTGGQGMDAAQMVATFLQRNGVMMIGATTPLAYRHSIESHSAFSSALQLVRVEEMDEEATIFVLITKVGSVEYTHHVYFTVDALEKVASFAKSYIKDRVMPEKAVQLLEEVAVYTQRAKGKRALVTGDDVAAVVAERTHIPVEKLGASEKKKLLNLETVLHERMIGQEEAVRVVAAALRRSRAGLHESKRPIANFLFLGPTGVGKTELAKTVADAYFGGEEHMVRLDMSEYQDGASLARLLGSEGGSGEALTDKVRANPFSLVLLDELEKAHPAILNVFLQVMDDGRLTDGQGRTVDFTNTILIATSNAAAVEIQDAVQAGEDLDTVKQRLMSESLRRWFAPEFLNRFDAVVLFRPLTLAEVTQIARLVMKRIVKQLDEKGIVFKPTDAAVAELAAAGYDPQFGARPLRRVVQERVEDAVAKVLLDDSVERGDTIVYEEGGRVTVEKRVRG